MRNKRSLINNTLYVSDIDLCVNSVVSLDQLRDKSVLVTGATGLIGSFIVDVLYRANLVRKLNIKIYALGRSYKRLVERFCYASNDDSVTFVEQDVTCEMNLGGIKVDYCIHAASNAYPAVMYSDPVGTILANIQGTYHLLEYLRKNGGKRFLMVSTGEVYGKCDSAVERFSEDVNGMVDVLKARSCYPLSKRMAENLCVSYFEQHNLETIIVRPCHTYGPNTTNDDNRANVQFVRDAIEQRDIVMKSQGLQLRSYAYISDVCSGLLTVLLNGKTGEAYNLCNNDSTVSISEFAEIVADKCGVKLVYELNDTQPSPFDRAVLNSSKLEKLGWNAKFDIYEGIEHTLEISRWLKC